MIVLSVVCWSLWCAGYCLWCCVDYGVFCLWCISGVLVLYQLYSLLFLMCWRCIDCDVFCLWCAEYCIWCVGVVWIMVCVCLWCAEYCLWCIDVVSIMVCLVSGVLNIVYSVLTLYRLLCVLSLVCWCCVDCVCVLSLVCWMLSLVCWQFVGAGV